MRLKLLCHICLFSALCLFTWASESKRNTASTVGFHTVNRYYAFTSPEYIYWKALNCSDIRIAFPSNTTVSFFKSAHTFNEKSDLAEPFTFPYVGEKSKLALGRNFAEELCRLTTSRRLTIPPLGRFKFNWQNYRAPIIANFPKKETNIVQAVMGLIWGLHGEWWFQKKRYHLALQGQFDEQLWMNFREFIFLFSQGNGDFSLCGLILKARLDF